MKKMKIAELFDELKSIAPCFSPDETCDTYKSGNSENEISMRGDGILKGTLKYGKKQ